MNSFAKNLRIIGSGLESIMEKDIDGSLVCLTPVPLKIAYPGVERVKALIWAMKVNQGWHRQ